MIGRADIEGSKSNVAIQSPARIARPFRPQILARLTHDPMDVGDATALGSWATVRGYFTPATLFLMLNLVIGTIALTSRSHQRRRREHLVHDDAHHHHHYQPPLDPHHQQDYNYYQPQPQYATPPPQPPAPLARTSSVLDRLRSIGLYRFRSGDFPPEYGAAPAAANHDVFAPVEEETATKQASWSEPAPAREVVEKKRAPPRAKKPAAAAAEVRKAQVARPPARSRVVEAVAKEDVVDARAAEQFVATSLRQPEPPSPPKAAEYHYQPEEYVPPPAPMRAPPPLSRTSSVLERLRSISLYSFLGAADQPAAAAPTDAFMTSPADDKKPAHPTHYDRSRSEPAREQAAKKKQLAAEAKMAKSSSSAARKPASAAPKLVEEECVDARAEAFIDSFRREQSQKQLHHEVHDDDEDHAVVPPPPAPLARTSSVLDRLRSFSLYLRSSDAVPEDPVGKKASSAAAADEKQQQQAQYARSRSEPAAKKKQEAKMSKTSSVAAAPVEECVDARADDFINKFRQQLQLQRLNSLLGGAKQ